MASNRSFLRLWGWPVALAILTSIGLLSALLGDNVWDGLSWLLLGFLPLLVLYYLRKAKRTRL